MPELSEIDPIELKHRLSKGDALLILDVREPWEIASASIAGTLNIPMGDIPSRLSELDPDRETIVMCHHGVRSAQVAMYLARNGFEHVLNLSGGIDAWSEIDPSVPRY
jgi:rhodanese-related sulfurtransferase